MFAKPDNSLTARPSARPATRTHAADTRWQRFTVEHEYPVTFTEDLFSPTNLTLLNAVNLLEKNKQHRLCIIIDAGVFAVYPALADNITRYVETHTQSMMLAGAPVIVAAGEQIKSDPEQLAALQGIVAAQHIDRHSFIIGIGGGALLDAVGLVAATSHRGIRHIRIPTTVLAQNDSGVGVKNGVNLFGQKNYLGTFAPPFAVLNDHNFISALPARDKTAGMAEAVKVALIRDAEFFHWLEDHAAALARFDTTAMQYMIRRCAELHMQQIAQGGDPFESGSARPLDFGHWSAHRLELLSNHELRHGEAVAIGIALDTHYSVLTQLLASGADSRVCALLETLGFTLWHEQLEARSAHNTLELIEGLEDFKEHLGGELTITLLESIGAGIEVNTMNVHGISQSISWLKGRSRSDSATVIPFMASSEKLQQPSVKATDNIDSLDSNQVIQHLQAWLDARLTPKERSWLQARLQLLQDAPPGRDIYITLGLIPRKLRRAELKLSTAELASARKACGRHIQPHDWTVDTVARALVIGTLQQQHSGEFPALFTELCKTAELQESIAFYRSTSLLPQSSPLDSVIGAGLRTHIRAIFDAIAHNNPYPQLHFDENRWNHMVLKALFIDSVLWPIQGLDERANPELAIILCDYAHERWAANRPVTPELWRCVGPFATGSMFEDLYTVLSNPARHSSDTPSQQAALLALCACPAADQKALQLEHPVWYSNIQSGILNWHSLGSGSVQALAA